MLTSLIKINYHARRKILYATWAKQRKPRKIELKAEVLTFSSLTKTSLTMLAH